MKFDDLGLLVSFLGLLSNEVHARSAMEEDDTKTSGSFANSLPPKKAKIKDLWNPWTFYRVFDRRQSKVHKWLRREGLLANEMVCMKCEAVMHLNKRTRDQEGLAWRCQRNRGHEKSVRAYSFFSQSHLAIQDIMEFSRNILLKQTLLQSSVLAGVNYQSTSVQWAKKHRAIFMQWVNDNVLGNGANPPLQFEGDVELDESVFGRKSKYHRGVRRGLKVKVLHIIKFSFCTITK